MILSVDSVSFSFIDDASFVQQVVAVLESDHHLLFLRIHAFDIAVHIDASVPDHVICKVDHGPDKLLGRRVRI